MIRIGKVSISPEREAILESCNLPVGTHDKVERIVAGSGRRFDFLAIDTLAPDGHRFFLGRFRQHLDAKVLGSDDEKSPFRIVAGPDIPADVWLHHVTKSFTTVARMMGVVELHDVSCKDVVGPMAFADTLQRVLGEQLGWSVSTATYDPAAPETES